MAGRGGGHTVTPKADSPTSIPPTAICRCAPCLLGKAIQALRADSTRSGSQHHDRDGPYLRVARSGPKTWRKDDRWQGVRQTFTIRTYPKVRLADVRKMAMQLNDWLREGIAPRTQTNRRRREREPPEARPFRALYH